MPDPHVLYVVTAIVVLGLVTWVIIVWTRPPAAEPGPPQPGASSEKRSEEPPEALGREPERAPKLNAHDEIHDEPKG